MNAATVITKATPGARTARRGTGRSPQAAGDAVAAPFPCPAANGNILVPVDSAGEFRGALAFAVALARRSGARVSLLHAVKPVPHLTDFGYGPVEMPHRDEALIRKACTRLRALRRRRVGPRWRGDVLVRSGEPCEEILFAAREMPADLIVLAPGGRFASRRGVRARTADNVVRHAPCPVLVVRGQEPESFQKRKEPYENQTHTHKRPRRR